MKEPRIYVDFNEMPCNDEVLLSKNDTKVDSNGNTIYFFEGMQAAVYMDDLDKEGKVDQLIANGVVKINNHAGWTSVARWLLKIDERGIRHVSEEKDSEPNYA